MKRIASIVPILLLAGCRGKTVYVWNMRDIIGLWILGIILATIAVVTAYLWTREKIEKVFNKNKKK